MGVYLSSKYACAVKQKQNEGTQGQVSANVDKHEVSVLRRTIENLRSDILELQLYRTSCDKTINSLMNQNWWMRLISLVILLFMCCYCIQHTLRLRRCVDARPKNEGRGSRGKPKAAN